MTSQAHAQYGNELAKHQIRALCLCVQPRGLFCSAEYFFYIRVLIQCGGFIFFYHVVNLNVPALCFQLGAQ